MGAHHVYKILTKDDTVQLLEGAGENRHLEFKAPFSWDDNSENGQWLKQHVVRAILAMTNTKTGGRIVIGISQKKNKDIEYSGISHSQLDSFANFEKIKTEIDNFSSSALNFSFSIGKYQTHDKEEIELLIIQVREFDEIPVLCRHDGNSQEKNGGKKVLTVNDLYCRSKKCPWSSQKVTEMELREIIGMTTDKEKRTLENRGWYRQDKKDKNLYDQETQDII